MQEAFWRLSSYTSVEAKATLGRELRARARNNEYSCKSSDGESALTHVCSMVTPSSAGCCATAAAALSLAARIISPGLVWFVAARLSCESRDARATKAIPAPLKGRPA